MSDADVLLDVLTGILHRYHPSADEADLQLRCHTDPDTLEIIRERCLRWALDLRKRGSVCQFWEKISHALRDVSKRKIDYASLPESVFKEISTPPRGEFIRSRERVDAVAEVRGIPIDNQTGKHENPGKMWFDPFRTPRRG
jgi:hypothetical protein